MSKGPKSIAIMNFKGGVGKTTLAVNLAVALASRKAGKGRTNVLLIDVDPQAHASLYMLGTEVESAQALTGIINRHRRRQQEFIETGDIFGYHHPNPVFSSDFPSLHLIASNHELRALELEIEQKLSEREWPSGAPKSYKLFSFLLEKVRPNYDYIIFDCAPNFHWLTASAIYEADNFIVPVIPDFLSIDGFRELVHLLSDDNKKKAPERQKRIRMIPVMLWASANDSVYAQYTGKLKEEIIPMLKNDGADIAEILKNCQVVDGLQRLVAVQKQVQKRRPLLDLNGADASRIQIENLAQCISGWR